MYPDQVKAILYALEALRMAILYIDVEDKRTGAQLLQASDQAMKGALSIDLNPPAEEEADEGQDEEPPQTPTPLRPNRAARRARPKGS